MFQKEPLKLNFSVYELAVKRRKLGCPFNTKQLDQKEAAQQEATDSKPDIKPDVDADVKPEPQASHGLPDPGGSGMQDRQDPAEGSQEDGKMQDVCGSMQQSKTTKGPAFESRPCEDTKPPVVLSPVGGDKSVDSEIRVKVEKDKVKSETKDDGISVYALAKQDVEICDKASVKISGKTCDIASHKQKSGAEMSVRKCTSVDPSPKTCAIIGTDLSKKTSAKQTKPATKVNPVPASARSSPAKRKFDGVQDKTDPQPFSKCDSSEASFPAKCIKTENTPTPSSVPRSSADSPKAEIVAKSKGSARTPRVATAGHNKASSISNDPGVSSVHTASASVIGPKNNRSIRTQGTVNDGGSLAEMAVVNATLIAGGKNSRLAAGARQQPPIGTTSTVCSSQPSVSTMTPSEVRSTMAPVQTGARLTPGSAVLAPDPRQVSSSPSVSGNGVPSAAAGAAGASSPTSAALAASSSPSPPMASSAACVRDFMEAQPNTSSKASSSVATAVKPTTEDTSTSSLKSASVSVADKGEASDKEGTLTQAKTSTDSTQSSVPAHSVTTILNATATKSVAMTTSGFCVTTDVLSAVSAPSAVPEDGNTASNSQPTARVLPTKETTPSQQAGTSSTKNKVAAVTATSSGVQLVKACRGVTGTCVGSKVSMGSQTTVVRSVAGILPSRNGMPTVVTKPTRVSNASTSVNTLLQKLSAASAAHSSVTINTALASPALPRQAGVGSAPSQALIKPSPCSKQTSLVAEASAKTFQGQSAKTAPKQPAGTTEVSKAGPLPLSVASGTKQSPRQTGIATPVPSQTNRSLNCAVQQSNKLSTSSIQQGSRASGSSGQQLTRSVASSTPAPTSTCRPSSAATPVPGQSATAGSGSETLVGLATSPLAVAMAARRASQIQLQALAQQAQQQQQQQQQQLLELQQLQLQQILRMQAVAALASGYSAPALLSPRHLQVPGMVAAVTTSPQSSAQPKTLDSGKKAVAETGKKPGIAGKKGGDPSPKKKISDIANSLHEKVSQSLGAKAVLKQSPATPTVSAGMPPPFAHATTTTGKPQPDKTIVVASASVAAGSSTVKTIGKLPTKPPSKSSALPMAKGEEEPLNLVVTRCESDSGGTPSTSGSMSVGVPAGEKSPRSQQ